MKSSLTVGHWSDQNLLRRGRLRRGGIDSREAERSRVLLGLIVIYKLNGLEFN